MLESELASLVGYRFPGGSYRVERWENWLLTDCTGAEPVDDGLVHPIVMFHLPILGSGMTIARLFELGQASGAGSVTLDGYDWEYERPLRQDVDYRVDGWIASAERRPTASGADDAVAFVMEVVDGEGLVARATNRWRFRRPAGNALDGVPATPTPTTPTTPTTSTERSAPAPARVSTPSTTTASATAEIAPTEGTALTAGTAPTAPIAQRAVSTATSAVPGVGDEIPSWTMPIVDPARMKTMAAILRDPYPIHWDRVTNERIGLGGRVVNQGPLNLGYIVNMLEAWAGRGSVRRLTVSFDRRVLDGESVTAHGSIAAVDFAEGGERRVTCHVSLTRSTEHVVTGTAVVAIPAVTSR